MSSLHVLSASEQVAAHLQAELLSGRWRGTMPGVYQLAAELAVSRSTVEAALLQLEASGVLVNQGPGRRRRIERSDDLASPSLRLAILLFEPTDAGVDYVIEIQRKLSAAGHAPFLVDKTLSDLRMDVKRVARLADRITADAWLIIAGSREVLEWFAARPQPAFALFGRRQHVPIASVGPETGSIIATVVRRLIELGHHRIVMLSRRSRRLPSLAQLERNFLAELEAGGIEAGSYNLPDWDESREGLATQLDSHFNLTPPTALIVDEPPQFVGVLRFLAGRGIRVPEDVSLVCTDPDRSFSWCEPPIAHISWDVSKAIQRVVRWANKVSCGKADRRQTDITAEFVEGGSIGSVGRH